MELGNNLLAARVGLNRKAQNLHDVEDPWPPASYNSDSSEKKRRQYTQSDSMVVIPFKV